MYLVGILFPHINDDASQNHIKYRICVFVGLFSISGT